MRTPAELVFPRPGEVRLFDTDPYYHLRHARYAAAHFPRLQRLDPGLFPEAQRAFYAGLYDVAIATAALIAGGGRPDPATVVLCAAWTPPVLGALVFLALFWLASRTCRGGAAAGVLAALLLLLYSGTFLQRSLLGFSDHHVAEALLALPTAAGLRRCLQRAREDGKPWWRPALVDALPLSIFLFSWFGAPIYIVLVATSFAVVATVELARGESARDVGRAAARYGLGVLVVILPVALVAPWLVMEPWMFGKAALAVALVAGGLPLYAWGMSRLIARVQARAPGRRRVAALVAVGATAVLALAIMVVASVAPGVGGLVNQLIGVKTALVKEQMDVSLGLYAHLGGAPAFIALAALPLAIVDAGKGRDERAALAPIVLASLVVGLWVRTHDYGYAAPPLLALLAAYAITRVGHALTGRRARVVAAVAVAVAVIAPWWPFAAVAPIVPTLAQLRPLMPLTEGWAQTLRWMNEHTPPLAQPLDQPLPPGPTFRHPPGNYGVQAFWDFGHYIAELAGRPPLASGGISPAGARFFLLTNEDDARALLRAGLVPGQHVRYCIADAQTAGDYFQSALKMAGAALADYAEPYRPAVALPGAARLTVYNERYRKSMAARLYVDNGDGLAHFRLVYLSRQRSALAYLMRADGGGWARLATVMTDDRTEQSWRSALARRMPIETPQGLVYEGKVDAGVKVFENVPGAHLTGSAAPGATVTALLELRAAGVADGIWHHGTAVADTAGRFDLIVPYPTEREADGTEVFAQSAYELHVEGGGSGRAVVTAAEVRGGARIEVTLAP